jgi:predicted secreted Zn-dependent protease
MKKHTRSILEELSTLGRQDADLLIEARANNIIESAINLLDRISRTYDAETAGELERRFLNSIRTGDPKKFKRGIQRVIESKKNDTE